jgi:hypothetical protein
MAQIGETPSYFVGYARAEPVLIYTPLVVGPVDDGFVSSESTGNGNATA